VQNATLMQTYSRLGDICKNIGGQSAAVLNMKLAEVMDAAQQLVPAFIPTRIAMQKQQRRSGQVQKRHDNADKHYPLFASRRIGKRQQEPLALEGEAGSGSAIMAVSNSPVFQSTRKARANAVKTGIANEGLRRNQKRGGNQREARRRKRTPEVEPTPPPAKVPRGAVAAAMRRKAAMKG